MNLDFRSLRIAFDAKRITHNATGLGNYGRTMVAMLARFAPQNRYDLYTPDPGRDELRRRLDGIPQLTFRYPRKPLHGPFKALWRSFGLSRELAPDTALFHGLSGELPSGLRKRGVRSVVTIHDLIFLRFPAYYKPVDRWIYTLKFRSACRRADRIIAISEATKRDVMHFFGIPEQKIDVIYQGCDERFKHPVDAALLDDVRRRHALPDHYILSVGSIEERKNLLLLLQAVAQLPAPRHVVAVGKRTPYTQQVEEFAAAHGLTPYLHVLEGVSFDDLPALYQGADLFVYPSRYEGFGIPMIEAANCGVPSIGATGSCLEEAGGPGALYVDPDDPQELARRIEEVLGDEALRRRMVADGRTWVARFEPEVIASELLSTYRKVLAL